MVGGQCHTLEMALEEVAIIVGQPLPAAARVEVVAERRNGKRLNLGGGYAADQSERRGAFLQHRPGDRITVAGAPPVCRGLCHSVVPIVQKAAPPECRVKPPPGTPAR